MRVRTDRNRDRLNAQSMPELLHGECVMRRRIYLPLDEADQRTLTVWTRGALAVAAVVVAATLVIPMMTERYGTAAGTTGRSDFVSSCRAWDEAAGGAISVLVHSGEDSDLRRASDAVPRMRRARRNCHAGWVNVACKDYQAVIQMAAYAGRPVQHVLPPSCAAENAASRLVGTPDD